MDLFKLLGTIAIDNSEAIKALDETSTKGQHTESKLSKAFGAIGKGAAACGKAIATGLAVGATAFAGLTAKALMASGELEQNMGGSEAVFGEHADKMQAKAKEAFSNMGLSTSDYLATANKMGALFQGAGFDIEESMNLSSDAMQRAADVASIMGIDTESAMEAVAGAAKGNFTMMDNLGVAMNDTAIQNYALSKGINKTTSEMTQQEKIGLAMEMFMDKTAYAAGNYAKENETLAGSLATAKAALTNFLDGSGDVESLVSSFGNLAKVAVNSLKEILPRLTKGLPEIINQILPLIPPLLEELLPAVMEGAIGLFNGVVSALPGLVNTFTTSILPTMIPQLISGLVSMAIVIAENLPSIIGSILAALPQIVGSIVQSLAENFLPLISVVFAPLKGGIESIFNFVKQNEGVFTALAIVIGTLTAAVIAYNSAAIAKKALDIAETIQLYAMTAAQTAHTIATTIATAATTAFGAAMAFLTSPITLVILAIGALIGIIVACVKNWDKIKEAGAKAWEWIKNAWSKAGEWFSGVWNSIQNAFANVGNWFKDQFSKGKENAQKAWANAKEIFGKIWNGIKGAFSNVGGWFKDQFNQGKENAQKAWANTKNFFSNLWSGIKNVFSNVGSWFGNVFTSAKNGVQNAWSGVKNFFSNIKNGIVNAFSNIKEKLSQPFVKAKDAIKGVIDKIKGFVSGLKLQLPKIKLPHFKVSGGKAPWGFAGQGSLPKIGIEWYAKAMDNPLIMDEPTIFGYDPTSGNLMGGGDAGSEVVSGTDTLMNMISNAVRNETAAQNDRIVSLLTALLEAIVGGNQELLRALLAGQTFKVGEREFARLVKEYA